MYCRVRCVYIYAVCETRGAELFLRRSHRSVCTYWTHRKDGPSGMCQGQGPIAIRRGPPTCDTTVHTRALHSKCIRAWRTACRRSLSAALGSAGAAAAGGAASCTLAKGLCVSGAEASALVFCALVGTNSKLANGLLAAGGADSWTLANGFAEGAGASSWTLANGFAGGSGRPPAPVGLLALRMTRFFSVSSSAFCHVPGAMGGPYRSSSSCRS